MIRTFGWAVGFTIAVLAGAFWLGGAEVLTIVAILAVLEISLSFDNAVVNATVLQRMNEWWQRIFLTIGVIIAVFGMRLVFPLLIVAVTAGLNPIQILDLAINQPEVYAAELSEAHPAIAAFGGLFLAMIFLDFMLQSREITWLSVLEKPLSRLGGIESLSIVLALASLLAASRWLAGDESATVLMAGTLGVVVYLLVNGLAAFFEGTADEDDEKLSGIAGTAESAQGAKVMGKAAFFLFLYLEVLDASFSFDGVIGAFAITTDIFVVAAGLGVGALYIRSMTIYLVRKGTLGQYVYLEHGAHYAIGALALILLVSISREVPEIVTGLIGVGFILIAFLTSVVRNRRGPVEPEEDHDVEDIRAAAA